MNLKEAIDKVGGRKFVFAFVSLAALVAGVLLVEDPNLFSTFAYSTVGLYTAMAGGNAGEHFARAFAKTKETLQIEDKEET